MMDHIICPSLKDTNLCFCHVHLTNLQPSTCLYSSFYLMYIQF